MGKFCRNCGNMLDENSKFCTKCGQKTSIYESVNVVNNQNENLKDNNESRNQGMAIGSFVCSLVGILFAGIPMGLIAISLRSNCTKSY